MTYNYDNEDTENEYRVEEAAPKYLVKQQGEYTIEDYYALPEDVRAELIDGVLYNMTAPRLIHQRLLLDIAVQLQAQIDARGGECQVFVAPLDVKLDSDNKTMVQPDVMILCDPDKEEEWGIDGAPDFLMEILSPSTRRKDMQVKLKKYRSSGVKEYWMIDPKEKKLYAYDFESGVEKICALEGVCGLALYKEEIKLNLSELAQKILETEERRSRKRAAYDTKGEQRIQGVEEQIGYHAPSQKSYTIEDYFALPEDRWAELIDGEFYEMETPPVEHQEIVMNFMEQVYTDVKARGDKIFPPRTSVQPDCDDATVMLPDVLIFSERDKQKKRVIYGAPDFVLEVLSPSTRRKDLTIKHRKYLNAGVREYWIIDPAEKRLITYDFEKGENVASYPFTEVVGLTIYGGSVTVDLRELAEIVKE